LPSYSVIPTKSSLVYIQFDHLQTRTVEEPIRKDEAVLEVESEHSSVFEHPEVVSDKDFGEFVEEEEAGADEDDGGYSENY